MSRRSLSDTARLACVDHANRAIQRSALLGIPSSTLLALIFGTSVPAERRIAFVALVSAADLFAFAITSSYLRRRRRGETIRAHWAGPLSIALIGLAWGSVAVIALPDAGHVDLRAIYLLFVCAVSATYVVGTAARRAYYYASQLPMLLLVTVAFVGADDRTTRLLGLAVPIYLVVMTALHREVHEVVVSELQLRERNDEANAQLREANTRLSWQASCDALTGLANRAEFVTHLHRTVTTARRAGTVVAVLYVDIDRFKVVNDSLGHGAGDELLLEVATRVQATMRNSDVLARFGGDEFTILLHEVAGDAEAVAIAERVADTFAAPFVVAERPINVTVSIGVATSAVPSDTADVLLSHADAAQYRAKELGRNRIEVFDFKFREAMQRRLDDEQELRAAIDADQIVPWFQPMVDLHTGQIIGAEALARWVRPARGVLDAGAFVPLAEEAGMILGLDNRIVRRAIETRAALVADGVEGSFRIWCNVSPSQFTRTAPTGRLSRLLDRTGCDPRLIGIEITESAVFADMAAAAQEVAAAREMGIKVALDDFGTGQSSLTLLRSLPIDAVKIDRTFVQELTRDTRDAAIVRRLVALAYDLGLDVVAEGVETPEQAQLLSQLGCRYAQGYLWAKALPVEKLLHRLHAQSRPTMDEPSISLPQ